MTMAGNNLKGPNPDIEAEVQRERQAARGRIEAGNRVGKLENQVETLRDATIKLLEQGEWLVSETKALRGQLRDQHDEQIRLEDANAKFTERVKDLEPWKDEFAGEQGGQNYRIDKLVIQLVEVRERLGTLEHLVAMTEEQRRAWMSRNLWAEVLGAKP